MKNFLIQESAMSVMPQISKRNENTVEFIAVLQEANRANRNGRIYRKEVLEQALAAPYVQERLRTNSFFSEAGHPMDTSVQRQMTIDQRNIACLIKEFWWEGDLLKAKVETANTAIGRDMKGLIEQGSRVAFSLRAQGNVHHDPMLNATVVESPIQIATYDWVVNPSHDKAFLESICEATSYGLFGSKQTTSLMLSESVTLFENGNLISLTEVAQPIVVDYAKNFGLKVKKLSEAYIYQEGDVLTESGKVATVVNDNVTKKVVLEDFLLKDLRHRIARLTEEEAKLGDEAAEPVHGSGEAKEHTPKLDNKDVYPADEHQQAEEVEEVIVEADKEFLDLLEAYSAEKQIDKVANSGLSGIVAKASQIFPALINPGFLFGGAPGALLFYLITKEKTKDFNYKAEKFAELAEKDPAIKALIIKIKNGIKNNMDQEELKKLKDEFKNSLKELHKSKKEALKEEAHISGQDVSKEEAKAVKPIEVLDNTGAIVKVEASDHTEIVNGVVKIKDHDHASEEGKKVRDALHESDHSDEHEPRNADEIAKGTHPIHTKIVDGEIEVEDHDHADAEGQEVRKEVIQEKKKLPPALEKNTYDDPNDGDTIPEKLEKKVYSRKGEEYSKEELMEAFQALDLDTDKYTFGYLAEQLGFKTVFPSDEHMEETDLDSKELGGEPSNARVAAQKPAKAGKTVESSEEIKSEKLGGEPTDARIKAQKPAKAGETLHHAEEVKAVIVESTKVKLGNIKVKGGK
jgi:hypothetical protein